MRSRNLAAISAIALLALAAYGVYATGKPAGSGSTSSVAPTGASLVLNDSTLATALRLVRLPTSDEEVPFARDALRLANQQLNLTFASAIRREAANPQPVTKEALEAQARLQRAQLRATADSVLVVRLSAENARTEGANKVIADSLDIAKARVQISADRVVDAKEELADTGGDLQGRLQVMIREHEQASRNIDSIQIRATPAVDPGGLLQTGRSLTTLRQKEEQLQEAAAEAESAATVLATQRRTSARRVAVDTNRRDSASMLAATERRALAERGGSRAENQRRLAAVYGGWLDVVKAQERAQLNRALRSLRLILGIVLVWLFSDAIITRLLATQRLERRSVERLRVVARVSLQLLGILLILFVLFGTPSNLGTIIGLAGAGLTVALKDFIVSFVGWLVLMGRDGVRIGDLVEINGVTGEVVELGLFNTVLHETGNWTDAGHPTGRRVTFTNSYAVEGHYFNFSTSGQWLWDEVRIDIPEGKNAVRVVESLQKRVEEVTADSARLAEQEWRGAARSPALRTITAAPAITIKPIMNGVEVTLRYITHAAERYEVRSKLYGAAVGVLGETA